MRGVKACVLLVTGAAACNATGAGSSSSDGAESDASSGDRFDLGNGDAMTGDCPPGGSHYEFIHLWVANSPDGTVSKIDTRARAEIGRYRTGAGDPDPSRTSVNLLGDMVVVNRAGSITKLFGLPERCPDENGTPGVQTSMAADDVLPWGDDECVAWHRELTAYPGPQNQWGPRPVAWEGAELDPETCDADPRVWVGWYDQPATRGEFRRLDGRTGETLDAVTIPWSGLTWGPYGGAVDSAGGFWAIGWQQGPLVRIDEDGTTYDVWTIPDHPSGIVWTYGLALDRHGRPWITSAGAVLYFDPETEKFSWIDTGNVMMRGMAADREGNVWVAVEETAFDDCGVAVLDYENEQLLAASVKLPGCSEPVGVGVDAEGFVWVIDHGSDVAFRLDPATYEAESAIDGLVGPYTYSDMTGFGLGLVYNPG